MTEEIINSDGSRNWQANILLDNVKRLEQENKQLKEENKTLNYQWHKQSEIGDEWYKVADKYKTALEEIQKAIKSYDLAVDNGVSVDTLYTISKIINEVLQ